MNLTSILLAAIAATVVAGLAGAGVIHFSRRSRSRSLINRVRSYTA